MISIGHKLHSEYIQDIFYIYVEYIQSKIQNN